MGFVFALVECVRCRRMFSCNPELVPTVNGIPICKECVEWANPLRKSNGLQEISVLPGAYDAQECA